MSSHRSALAAAAALLLFASLANAQLNNPWVTFSQQNSHLAVPPLPDVGHPALTDSDTQVLFRTGDLDRDGWPDVVAVRKQQGAQIGKRTAALLMNVHGVLTDKTAQYATASDAGFGDQGFLTPCNNSEVAIGDINTDGWPDVVTAVILSDGSLKYISHPRIYRNLGKDLSGNWLGLIYEETRFPQLFTTGGNPVAPRFGGMALGDVTGDGFPDLYFVDFDTTETGIGEQLANDLNDRFLRNDGNGYFIDESSLRFTPTQLGSRFGADCEMYDINHDGLLDIAKDTTLDAPRVLWGLYNNPANPGFFNAMGTSDLGNNMPAPYGMDLGDLNRDANTDVVIVDDGIDKFHLGTGVGPGPLFYASWQNPTKTLSFIAGAGTDEGQGKNAYIRDLDGNGWNDVLITGVSGDVSGCGRRLHIFHNTGSVPGDMNLVLREEAELASGEHGAGWKGVQGMLASDLQGSYDVAFGDFDHDGDLDLLVGLCAGTSYWQNETDPAHCQTDLGFAGPGTAVLSVCGAAPLAKGYTATLSITGAAPSTTAWLTVGFANSPTPLKGGTLVPVPIFLLVPVPTTGAGTVTIPGIAGGGGPASVYIQAIIVDGSQPTGFAFTNAVRVDLLANP